MNRRQAGRKGGQRTLALYGREHMRAIGKRGYQTTLARHWQGDALAYRRRLIARGWNAITDELAGREIDRRIGAGEQVLCDELLYLDEEQDMPW
jgi:general stress protein YciG